MEGMSVLFRSSQGFAKGLRSEGRLDVHFRRTTPLSAQSDVLKSKSDVTLPAKIFPET